MCIRDRIIVGFELLTAEDGGLGPLLGVRLLLILIFAVLGAVSYTHLRAHETVLDLVCRLLLEKKKITRTLLQL